MFRANTVLARCANGAKMAKNLAKCQKLHQSAVASSRVTAEPFLTGTSSVYIEEMYSAWLENPSSVHKVSDYDACPLYEGYSI